MKLQNLALLLAELVPEHTLDEAVEGAQHLAGYGAGDVGDRVELPRAIPVEREHDRADERSEDD